MVYRFIDDNKNIFGLRWLCNKFGISPNCYYNYKKEAKRKYHKRLAHIFELIKYVYYNNNCVIGYRAMRIFIKRYGYEVSNTTMPKYMNKELNLCAVIMHSKPGYKTGKKNKIFDNLLNQKFTVDCKNKVWCTDFIYMRQPNGKFRYNCSIIDLYDRSAVASLAFRRSVAVPSHSFLVCIKATTFRRKGCSLVSTGISPSISATSRSPLVIFILAHSFRLLS